MYNNYLTTSHGSCIYLLERENLRQRRIPDSLAFELPNSCIAEERAINFWIGLRS